MRFIHCWCKASHLVRTPCLHQDNRDSLKRKKEIIGILWEVVKRFGISSPNQTRCALMAESDMTSSRLSVAWRILLHHYSADRQA